MLAKTIHLQNSFADNNTKQKNRAAVNFVSSHKNASAYLGTSQKRNKMFYTDADDFVHFEKTIDPIVEQKLSEFFVPVEWQRNNKIQIDRNPEEETINANLLEMIDEAGYQTTLNKVKNRIDPLSRLDRAEDLQPNELEQLIDKQVELIAKTSPYHFNKAYLEAYTENDKLKQAAKKYFGDSIDKKKLEQQLGTPVEGTDTARIKKASAMEELLFGKFGKYLDKFPQEDLDKFVKENTTTNNNNNSSSPSADDKYPQFDIDVDNVEPYPHPLDRFKLIKNVSEVLENIRMNRETKNLKTPQEHLDALNTNFGEDKLVKEERRRRLGNVLLKELARIEGYLAYRNARLADKHRTVDLEKDILGGMRQELQEMAEHSQEIIRHKLPIKEGRRGRSPFEYTLLNNNHIAKFTSDAGMLKLAGYDNVQQLKNDLMAIHHKTSHPKRQTPEMGEEGMMGGLDIDDDDVEDEDPEDREVEEQDPYEELLSNALNERRIGAQIKYMFDQMDIRAQQIFNWMYVREREYRNIYTRSTYLTKTESDKRRARATRRRQLWRQTTNTAKTFAWLRRFNGKFRFV